MVFNCCLPVRTFFAGRFRSVHCHHPNPNTVHEAAIQVEKGVYGLHWQTSRNYARGVRYVYWLVELHLFWSRSKGRCVSSNTSRTKTPSYQVCCMAFSSSYALISLTYCRSLWIQKTRVVWDCEDFTVPVREVSFIFNSKVWSILNYIQCCTCILYSCPCFHVCFRGVH